jgi:hypothetical protein
MEKRKIIIGTYDTALEGLWTLASWSLSKPVANEEYLSIPGHSGPLDVSTVLTDGEPYYGSRTFEAVLESSEGSRLEREERINQMLNKLDGLRFNITLPDDPTHYINGRVSVEKVYNNPYHASVQVRATCDPWRYNNSQTAVSVTATSATKTVTLINNGRLSVIPRVKITGGTVAIKYTSDGTTKTWNLNAGEYNLVDIHIKTGTAAVTYSGSGTVTFTYREAVL